MLRNEYVAQRVLARMKSRGQPMTLRAISMLAGPEPFRNPPDVAGLTVIAGSHTAGQSYIGLAGSTVIGRLVPGDKVTVGAVVMTVQTMPANVLTDADGISQVNPSTLNPLFGSPPSYHADTLAWGNKFPVVAVDLPADPSVLVGQTVTATTFVGDQLVYGNFISAERMVAMGWVEIDSIGVSLAGRGINPQPKVNDLLFIDAEKRSIMQVGRRASNGVNFLYPVQAR
jgi:hypothetical protein